MRSFFISLVFAGISLTVSAIKNTIFDENVHTLQVVVNDDWLSPAVMRLGSSDVLRVSFDFLSQAYQHFTYRIDHYEYDWTKSERVYESDYLQGFNNNTVRDYDISINTTVPYAHYKIEIPNDQCRIKMSGNYVLTVLDEEGNRVLEARFMVAENTMSLGVSCTTDTDIDVNKSHQQLYMTLNYNQINVTNFRDQLHVIVTQNNLDSSIRQDPKPSAITSNGLSWNKYSDLIFDAGTEYRKYEVLDVTHPTMGIDRIDWDGDTYNVYPEIDLPKKNYFYDEDADGAFYIRNSDNIDNDITTEYVMVHYRLKTPVIDDKGTVFIDGQWATNANTYIYDMYYDYNEKMYCTSIMQKQGYYSYQYFFRDQDGKISFLPTDGSFFQTKNRYQAYVYYRGNTDRTWRLMAWDQLEL